MAQAWLTPYDVSFENIMQRELGCLAVADGFLSFQNNLPHDIGKWIEVGRPESDVSGSPVGGTGDTIQNGPYFACPEYSDGTFLWDIPREYVVGLGPAKVFTSLQHFARIYTNGTLSLYKAGWEEQRAYGDLDSNY